MLKVVQSKDHRAACWLVVICGAAHHRNSTSRPQPTEGPMLEGMVEGTSKEFASFGENLTNGRLTEQLVHHQYHGDYHERILSPAAAASSQRYQHHHRQPDHQQQQHENHDFYSELVNINWIGPVRTMIAQNLAEISLICVIIIIYLVYYFSQISKVSSSL